ncbi:MAG: hypothetical protein C0608_06075 [Deltaproteobacteria bacterium]|nr:MAG: hypothetical protein C0608_06075 [Deltaproteobacteria bacterium]
MFSKFFKISLAGVGFFIGFLWTLHRWAGSDLPALILDNSGLLGAAMGVYALMLLMLVTSSTKRERDRARTKAALKMRASSDTAIYSSVGTVLAPLLFFGSFLLGATGMGTALWLIV